MKTPRKIAQRIDLSFSSPTLIALAQPERLFLALSIVFGILFALLLAPFQAPDEYVHFFRSYEISTGHLSGTQAMIPASVLDFSRTISQDLPGNDQNKQSKKALLNEFSRAFEDTSRMSVSVATTAIYSPLPYFPQALGIFLGRLLHLSPILIFYFGRLFNLLAWIGLTFYAIRAMPLHPRLFAALALMPMTLHQAASFSPDAVTNAISFLFIAYTLKILSQSGSEVKWGDWGKLGLLICALALCKSIYILLVGLLVLVPLRHFRQQRAVLPLTLVIFVLGITCGLGWLRFSALSLNAQSMNELQTPTSDGLIFVMLHPQVAAPIFWQTAITHTPAQLRMFIGILGWLDTPLPAWVYPVYFALLVFIAIFEPHPRIFLSLFERVWVAGMAFAAGLVMMAAFFYPDVTVGNGIVGLIQGRYYIPFGPLYFFPLSQRKWSFADPSPTWVIVGLLHGLVLLAALRALVWRYYAI
jgi:uncharacterized membrane protein